MNSSGQSQGQTVSAERLAAIEARLDRIEEHLRLAAAREDGQTAPGAGLRATELTPPPAAIGGATVEEMEFVLGQKWFAYAGIVVLAIGAAFTLSLPYANLPAGLPSVLGYVLVGGIFLLAHCWRESFDLVSRYLRPAGMALLYFATLRLFFFAPTPVLSTGSVFGKSWLLGVVVVNLGIALRRPSPYLIALALGLGYFTALLLDSNWILFATLTALSAVVVYASLRHRWPLILLLGIHATYAVHFLWAVNNPLRGAQLRFVIEPLASVFFILGYGVILASPSLFRRDREEQDPFAIVSAVVNAGACYGLFLLHTLAAFNSVLVFCHLVASGVFLALAVALWVVKRSQLSCFFYAITGYLALSVAILKAFAGPSVFVWLSVQSVVVVTTALWFRSRFIVVANFFIYLATVAGYMLVSRQETGISLGFGLVALFSARILNWKKERLQFQTDKMRNAYLACVFVVFPYALYHLVPRALVAVSWVGVAGVYYLLGLVLRNQKYRWMGHGTLVLTVFYVLIVGIIQLKSGQRILSYLVLGTVLVAISLIFSRQRDRDRRRDGKAGGPG